MDLPWSVTSQLPLLETLDGRRVPLSDNVYLEGKIQPQGKLGKLVTIIRLPENKGVQKTLKENLTALTENDVWGLLKNQDPWREWEMLLQVPNLKEANETPWLPLKDGKTGILISRLVFLLNQGRLVGGELLQELARGSDFYTVDALTEAFTRQAFQVVTRKDQKDTCVFQNYFSLEAQVPNLRDLLSSNVRFASGLPSAVQPEYLA